MAITYKSGRRIQATAADFAGTSAVVGGWKEVGRTTLGSSGFGITVSGLPDKRYYMVLTSKIGVASGNSGCWLQLNGDTGSNYAYRMSNNGGSDSASTGTTNGGAGTSATPNPAFGVRHISNLASKEKLIISNFTEQNTAGAGTAPQRRANVAKWANTSSAISEIKELNVESNPMASGSETVILGWDEDDTHSTNFWEELASVELGTTADELSSGTFTAKKYLMVQYYVKKTGTANTRWRFNNDTGSNYAARQSGNGGADGTLTAQTSIYTHADTSGNAFGTIFIVNNSANEKLGIFNEVSGVSSGAGTAPARREVVAKWSNTSSQITEIDLLNTDSGGFASGTIMKVWGSN